MLDEIVADGDILYRYVFEGAIFDGQVQYKALNAGELSCDWDKHCSQPEQTPLMLSGRYRILEITISQDIRNPKNEGKIEPAWHQEIIYNPVTNLHLLGLNNHYQNFSHCIIKGKKKNSILNVIISNSKLR